MAGGNTGLVAADAPQAAAPEEGGIEIIKIVEKYYGEADVRERLLSDLLPALKGEACSSLCQGSCML
ncbi:hypothetical protein [Thermofilum sp.]|uniref:hypothetical protein n=1 Tax=Thermofilum sp. TaxID=1961369 RepID=UPI00317BF448